ncbi:MAG: outer membrane protein [Pseudomonadota bacterium]
MKQGIHAFALCLSLAAAPAAAEWNANLNAFLGAKALDEDDWVADAHSEAGLMIDFGGENWPVHIAMDVFGSRGDYDGMVYNLRESDLYYYEEEVRTSEFNFGLRRYWRVLGNMHPYVGGGIAFVHLKAEAQREGEPRYSDSGSGEGLWLGGGIQWRFEQFNLGFNLRTSYATVELDSGDYDGGGGHAGVVLGFNF